MDFFSCQVTCLCNKRKYAKDIVNAEGGFGPSARGASIYVDDSAQFNY